MLAIATGDFNGDGNPDLVVAGAGTELLLGDGNGGFVQGAPIPANFIFGGSLLAVADFNGDGKLDLLTWNACYSFLWLGDGKGGFGQPRDSLCVSDRRRRF